jgi:hypothetical protein
MIAYFGVLDPAFDLSIIITVQFCEEDCKSLIISLMLNYFFFPIIFLQIGKTSDCPCKPNPPIVTAKITYHVDPDAIDIEKLQTGEDAHPFASLSQTLYVSFFILMAQIRTLFYRN